ncbi:MULTISPECIES: non-ribosomal peptide synthase/polyketide synthase [unclassified Rhodococcus (in: high G+C Gram-positive bacteria)]|uniref:non-ribosomal peptide synthase/polyketide synthase n=1 Tax=unclassified Rhodococcus (in: high G+C Gram-positive bacteria) TaxID=192944 RepID=UPI00211AD200|nr:MULTISPECIES: non-ribosomal peptide synthase/polyketide synthase [unclassified Rhodococcus (in: high G+C Gram-positive bacteria)]
MEGAGRDDGVGGPEHSSFPLSPAQLGMWFAQHVDPSVPANIAQYIELHGDLDVDLLRRASSQAALELQSGFVRIVEIDAEPRQVVDPTLDDSLNYLDLRGEADPRAAALAWMHGDYSAPIDILRDRLIAATVLRLEDDVWFWYERVHHVVLDGFGAVTFMNRAAELYTAAVEGTEPSKNLASDLTKVYDIDVAYRDSSRFEADREYWASRIDGIDGVTTLAGHTAAPAATSQIDSTALSAETMERLEALRVETDTTMATIVIAGFAAYLAQMTGREDVVLSLPVTARTTAVLRRSGGMVSNVVPLRLDVSGDTTVETLLARVNAEVSGALRHQRYRHEDIRRDAGAVSGQASFFGPWVNIMLFFGEVRLGSMVGGINILSTGLIEDFGLNLYTSVAGSTTHIDFESNPNLYGPEQSGRNHERFVDFFARFVASGPKDAVWDLALTEGVERELVVAEWNATEHPTEPRTLLSAFEAAAAAHPDATALVYEGEALTYGALSARVNGLARHLIDMGVGPETLVGLSIRRSFDLVVGMYAIVAAGGAWVPIDPDHPADRTAYILDSAQPRCVLISSRDDVALPEGTETVAVDLVDCMSRSAEPVRDVERIAPLRLSNTAYVIYTSGSTGRPKGVAVEHAAIHNQMEWMLSEYPMDASDVYLQKTATTFDVSLWGFFLPLRVGATMVLATPDGHRDSVYVADKIAEHRVTVTDFVPSMLTVFVANAPAGTCSSLRHVFVIGEALPVETAAAFRSMCRAGLHNLYGPTEAAVSVTYHPSGPQDTRTVPIGVPEWNTKAFVLDGRLRPTPIGESGELYLAGVQLARGYVGRPDLSSDRFVANPFGTGGDRMYRTGDLVRWRSDGVLDYIGRTDFQVKFRGQRIELGEIETVLLAHESISQAVVLVVQTVTGDQLVAYVVATPGRSIESAAAIEFAGHSLPSYMVPAAVVVLDALPLNTSGKLDRKALPEPMFSSAKKYRAPQSRAEYVVAGIYEDLLGASKVGLDEDFFELGGNSLIATQLVTRVGSALGVRLGVRELFEAPTVGALAARAESAARLGADTPVLESRERPERIPLSPAQQRMWFLNRFDPTTAVYNLPFSVRLTGPLDVVALSAAFADVVDRHETLRTVYPEVDGSPEQVVLTAARTPATILPVRVERDELGGRLHELVGKGFDVTVDTPFRIALFEISPTEHELAMVLHHIAADGASFGPLARDVLVAYSSRIKGRAPEWTPLEVQYADYALWQRAVLGPETDPLSLASREIAYWRATLEDLPDQLTLPSSRPRPAVSSNAGSKLRVDVPARLHASLASLARANNASLFMVMQSAYALLLARLSGTTDIAIGAPVAGRGEPALDDLVGMFVNTLVLRTEVDPALTFEELLSRVRDTDLSAFAHADVPFERLVEVLNPVRSTSRHPLFQVAISLESAMSRELTVGGLRAEAAEFDVPIAKFDVQLWLTEHLDDGAPAGIDAVFEYATDLFDADLVESFARRFLAILDAVTTDATVPVGDVTIVDAAEHRSVLSQWNASGDDVSRELTLVDLLDAAAAAHPDAVAVRFDGSSMTYAEFDAHTNRLARVLISHGVGPESLVAVALPRSAELVVALVAVIKAGGGYLPVDPSYPLDRVEYMLDDARPTTVLLSGSDRVELPSDVEIRTGAALLDIDTVDLSSVSGDPVTDGDRTSPLRPENVAYVIYTSGSTGKPKGVMIPHRNVVRLLDNTESVYGFGADDVWTMFHSYAFDFSVWELWGPLLYGGTLVVVDYFTSRSPEAFHRLLVDEQVTVLNQTPSAFYQLSEADRTTATEHGELSLRYVIFGGEALEQRRLTGWFERHGHRAPQLVNMYGITETTVHVSYRALDAASVESSASVVGKPIAGLRVFVLDTRLHPVPVGVPGEMYVAGGQLARGYLGRRELTSVRFVANPFASGADEGSLLYRTGDLAQWNAAGELEYLGRSDDQVKVRGFRIELGEVEAAVTAQPTVTQAAVIVREDSPGAARLVAYVVSAAVDGRPIVDIEDIRTGIAEMLPEYMVPSAFVVLDAIPLTVNGKLDRRALPAPVFEVREFRAPTTPIEEIVADVFADVLGVERVGLDDDFFELGGNSLIATQVVSRLGVALDATVPVRMLFEASTVALLAVRVEQAAGEGGRIALVATVRPERIPLSLAQQRMWFLNRFDADSTAYNIPFALRLTGELDVAALQVAIMDVIDRHESLRTVYPDTAAGPQQSILDAAQTVPNLMPVPTSAADIQRQVFSLASTTFDVTVNVPIQARLFEIGPREHVIAMVVHHISADGWSMGPLARDLMIAYASRTAWENPAWMPLEVQYADYSLWQRSVLGSEDDPQSLISGQVDYWADMLAGLPDQLDLPTDRPRPNRQSYQGSSIRFDVPAEVHRGLSSLAHTHNASLFMVVHAALAVLLARLSGTEDIAIGTPVAGRGDAALDDVVGMFVNTLVLRTDIESGRTFSEQIGRAREVALGAFGHADLPFERLVEVLNPSRSQARHPLFQVMLSFENLTRTHVDLPGLSVDSVALDAEVAKFDLQLTVTESIGVDGRGQGMAAELTYATDLFDAATVRGFSERFVRILGAVVADPSLSVGDIDLLDDGERDRVVTAWNRTEHEVPDQVTLVDLFDRQVAVTPDAQALVFEGERLTYAEFAGRANRLARLLVSVGVGPDSLVGLAIGRSLDLFVGMYAIVKAGAGYVPIDPSQPADRNEYIVATAAPVRVLSTTRDHVEFAGVETVDIDTVDVSGLSPLPLSDAERTAPLRASNLAYVIFTSGSTGRPKGVGVSHEAIVNRLLWMQHEYGLSAGDVVLQKTPSTFDVSVWEFFWALQNGASVAIAVPDGHRDALYLLDVIAREHVSVVHFVPSMMSVFVPEVERRRASGASLRLVFASGEALAPTTARALRRAIAGVELHNLYGPTEAAVDVTYHAVTDEDSEVMPIGAPVWNTSVYVLDSRLNPTPVGVAGELYLAGTQLARGYVGRSDLTADRFVAHPFATGGRRLYRTGDVVRWNRNGELEYVGRSDFQVKLRGLRIELGEIESALLAQRSISQAVVVVRHEQLVGYVVPAGASVETGAVLGALRSRLAEYMVPSTLIVLEEFPLGASGKLDRKALPDPAFEVTEYREPTNDIERTVAEVFAQVLGVERVGLDDDFFELGGNSLIATQLVSRLGVAMDTRIAVRELFDTSTVADLAARLGTLVATGSRPPLVPQQRPQHIPLSLAQQRMWFLNKFDVESAANNIPIAVRLSGLLDRRAMQIAVADVVARQQSLRTVFPETDGTAHQVIVDAASATPDLTPIDIAAHEVADALRELATTGFDLSKDLPFRTRLFEVSPTEHLLVFVVHHIAADGFSLGPLTRDVMNAYAARSLNQEPFWSPLPIDYADYSLWQRQVLGSEDDPQSVVSQQIDYWTTALAGLPDQLDVPSDRPRPVVASNSGALVRFSIDEDLHRALIDAARAENASLFMVVHTSLAVLLSRLSGEADIAIGTPVAGRGEAALDDLIGMFVNTLVLRTEIDTARRFDQVLADTRETDLSALAHVDVPFERLVEILNPARSTARHPLVQVVLAFQNLGQKDLELPGLSVSGVDFETLVALFDLQFTFVESIGPSGAPQGMTVDVTYATDLFDEATVVTLGDRLITVLEAVAGNLSTVVGDIELLEPVERRRVLVDWNDTEHEVDRAQTLASLGGQVDSSSTALVFGDDTLTYGEFQERVARLARYLIAHGVGPESAVGIAARRSVELLVGIHAIIAAGGAYVPIDPDQPAERIAHILGTAAPVCVLTTSRDEVAADGVEVIDIDTLDLSGFSDAPITDADRISALAPSNTAYVIFTSGSTGQPKGVAVTHEAIVNRLLWMQSEYELAADDVVLQKTPVTFDVSVWELFWPLQIGATLVIAKPEGHRDPQYLLETIEAQSVTTAHFVPSLLEVFVSVVAAAPSPAATSLRTLFASGEALPAEVGDRLRRVLPGVALHNLYGPTEAAVDVTYHAVTEADVDLVPIGVPVWNTRTYVLDARLSPVAPGVAGELYLAGVQLARGYLGRTDLTADRFLPDPFGEPGTRMYRTGDLVRWRAVSSGSGRLEYLGRTDFQVKLRGLRIELGEIETVLRRHPSVESAVVLVRQTAAAGDQLVAYVVPAVGGTVDVAELADFASRSLASYMVPAATVVLDALPLTPNGKLDRRALPEPNIEQRPFRAPSTTSEIVVAEVFRDVLGIDVVGADDEFFALGGNSLVATRVASRIGAALDTTVTVRTIFEASTVSALAAKLDELSGSGRRIPLVRTDLPDLVPLSLAQRRMWFLNRFDPESATENLPVAIELGGDLDIAALRAAVADVVERHESLRTVYPEVDGVASQVIVPAEQVTPDLVPTATTTAELPSALAALAMGGFDVTAAPPLRAALFELDSDRHVLAFVTHHIAADGFSIGPMTRDLMVAYAARSAGTEPGWTPLAVRYVDYTLWQQAVLGSEDDPTSPVSNQIRHWTRALSALPDEVTFPGDRVRPDRSSYRGGNITLALDAETHGRLGDVARANQSSLFMVLHSSLAVLLARLSGETDIAIGTPVAGRGEAALDDVIGMFVNTLVLRTDIDHGDAFTELLARARETDLSAFAHAEVPFERLVEVLDPPRSAARHPLVQVMLTVQNMEQTELELPGLSVRAVDLDVETAKFDVQFTFTENHVDGGMTIDVTFARDLYDDSTARALGERLIRVLESVAGDPGQRIGDLPVMDEAERGRVLALAQDAPAVADSLDTIVDLFAARVAEDPDAPAVVFEGAHRSYREIDESSTALARVLAAQGVGPESLVAVVLPRTADLVVALLAVLKAGGAYVPIDPSYPADRIEFVLTDSRPVAVLTWTGVDVALPATLPRIDIDTAPAEGDGASADPVPASAASTAYVIYTSGSTGKPKGVLIPHRNVVRLLANTARHFDFGRHDVWTLFHSFAFDFSVWELWGPLTTGGSVVVVDYFTSRSPEALRELLVRERVTVLNQTPSAFYQLDQVDRTAGSADDYSLRYIVFGGEALELRRLTGWFERHGDDSPQLVNMYGITETTVHVSHRVVDARSAAQASGSLVGRAISGLSVYVLDSRLSLVPAGVPGEMYVSGGQVARGYLGRAGLSATRFVADPFAGDGSVLYRTGDVARWSTDGELEFVGRADDQVKIRGFRIELGEVESAVASAPAVGQAAVIVREDTPGAARLVAYVVPAAESTIDIDVVRAAVGENLPEYMVPSAFVVLDAIPLTANGKLDRRALPEPAARTREFRPPTTPVEGMVADVFADVLGIERVGLDDDFFELGGNSLVATQVVSRLGAAAQTTVPVRALFEAPTVAALAARVEQGSGAAARPALVASTRPSRVPLSLAQQRMWFLNRFDSESTAYNIPFALRLSGRLDVDALQRAVSDVIERHETLRSVYPDSPEGPHQVIVPMSEVPTTLEVIDTDAESVTARVLELLSATFDVTTRVPLKTALFRVSDTEFVLGMVIHHISADGLSVMPLSTDVMTAYAARTRGSDPAWAPLPVQYADYALWQRQVLGSEEDSESIAAQQIRYWEAALAELPEQIELPLDRPRPAEQTFRGGRIDFRIDAAAHARLTELARAHNATVFMAVHAAFAVLLSRISGSPDIVVGTPIAGRGEAAIENLVGMFVNTLVLRLDVEGGESFEDLLDAARETDLQAFANSDIPFERLVEVVNPTRSTARHPLFQVGFSFQNFARREFELDGLDISALDTETGTSQFDLHLIVSDAPREDEVSGGFDALLTYATDLFDERTARSLVARFEAVLDAVAASPSTPVGDLDLFLDGELPAIVDEWNDTDRDFDSADGTTLADLFVDSAARNGDAVALVHEDGTLTYGEFSERVSRLARHLIGLGVGPEVPVGLAIRRSVDLLVGMYAISVAGGAYVPIDPDQPAERNALVLETAAPLCVLTSGAVGPEISSAATVVDLTQLDLASFSPAPVDASERSGVLSADNTAYVIFTSGSTGRPKGVAVSHGAVVNQLNWLRAEYGLDETDAALLKTAATFDLSVWEFWSQLTSGGRLVVANPEGHRDPDYLLTLVRRHSVTTLHLVPSMLSMLGTVAAGELSPDLRRVLAIGEALPAAVAQDFRRHNGSAELHNLYGPTEAAVSVTSHPVTDADTVAVPIGVPEANTAVFVLDSRLHPVPAGVTGELYLAGTQLARGYFGRADLTAERFVANPFDTNGTRMYRTGDLVRWRVPLVDGEPAAARLEYIERADFQVKIRGFRIELGEIEAALRAQATVADTAVVVHSGESMGDQLVAYVVGQSGAILDVASVEAELARAVPSYMVPAAFVVLDALPLNANGKLDRRALPAPQFEVAEFRAPVTPIEEIVASTVAELLGLDRAGLDDDFFALGGNSLVATQLVSRLGQALDAQIPVRAVFAASTVAGLAAHIAPLVGGGARRELTVRERPDLLPLSIAQERMWTINRIDPGSSAYNIPVAVRLTGELDIDSLRGAFDDVLGRHEILRTAYPDSVDGPVQQIGSVAEVGIELTPKQVEPDAVISRLTETLGAGFDVTKSVPVRAALLQVGVNEHVLAVVAHHIAADGFSMGPLIRDVMVAYTARVAGEMPAWTPLPVQYADFALWQREVLGSESDPDSPLAKQLAYWTTELAGAPEQLALPLDRPRPPRPTMQGASYDFSFGTDIASAIEKIAREHSATTFMVVHSAFAVLLSRLSNSSDISIGTPTAGRGEQQLDELVGMFVNTLVLRTRLNQSGTFVELLQQAKDKDLAAFGHADVPFERLVDALGRARSSAYTPLFQAMLTFQNHVTGTFELPGLQVQALPAGEDQAKFDLQLTAVERFDDTGALRDIEATFTYATAILDESSIATFADRLLRILNAVVSDPDVVLRSIDILSDEEKAEFAPRTKPKTVDDLPELVARAATVAPDAVAIEHESTTVDFAALHAKLAQMSATMGSAMKPQALVTVTLSALIPGILPALGAEGLTAALASLIERAESVIASS